MKRTQRGTRGSHGRAGLLPRGDASLVSTRADRPTATSRRDELAAFIARFPQPGRLALAFHLACVVIGNAYLLWLVWQDRLSLTGVVLLVLVEGLLLTMLEVLQRVRLPPAHRLAADYAHYGMPQKFLSGLGLVFGIGGAYALWVVVLDETSVLASFFSSLDAWRAAGLPLALGITMCFAIVGLVADHYHYRRAGPPLVSSVAMEATARRMTFIYGAIVIALPMIALVALITWAVRRYGKRRDDPLWNFIGGIAVLAAFFSGFAILASTAGSGPHGWAAIYLLGKVLVEALFVLMPMLARRAARA